MDIDRYQFAKFSLDFVAPIAEAITSPVVEKQFLKELGFVLPEGISLFYGLKPGVDKLVESAINLALLDEKAKETEWIECFAKVMDAFMTLIGNIHNLADGLTDTARNSPFITETDILQVLPSRLLDYLIASYLKRRLPVIHRMLLITSVHEESSNNPHDLPYQTEFSERKFYWDRLSSVVSDPLGLLKERYGWDNPTGIDAELLFIEIRTLGTILGLRTELQPIDHRAKAAFDQALAGTATIPDSPETIVACVPLLPMAPSPIGVEIYPVADNTGKVDGLGIALFADPTVDATFQLTDNMRVKISLASFTSGFGLLLRREQDPRLTSAIGDTPSTMINNIALDASTGLIFEPTDGSPFILLGVPTTTHLEVGSLTISFGLKKPISGDMDFFSEINLKDVLFLIQSSDCDGFLNKILPSDPIKLQVDLCIQMSLRKGITFRGSGGFETVIPINKSIFDILKIESLYVAFLTKQGQIGAVMAATASTKIGPISASIDKIGLVCEVHFPEGRGVNFNIGFKPPTGLGLVVEAGPVAGGGFIYFDPDKGRYGGILQLGLPIISLKAIGLLDTKLPGGVEGYSFLIIITGEFPPIQLGFGFCLAGLGGLAGIHRTMVTEALQAGIRGHSVDHILFPEDPVANAPQILSDLSTFFPPVQGQYIFGPMAILGWGPQPLIWAEMGILLELPDPVRIVLLGQLHAALPLKEEAVAELHLDILGILDFGQKCLSIDAVLHDSRLACFSLFGDMALRLSWGGQPAFAFAIGGFNPHFQPPVGFPDLRRLTLALGDGGNPSLTLQTYLAITSNTLQFGAAADLYAEKAGFNLTGHVGFDVLVLISPLSLLADLQASLSLKRDSTSLATVKLDATLTGPTPWRLWGEATWDTLIDVTVGFDLTIGEDVEEKLPDVDPWPLLKAALETPGNWSGTLPDAAFRVVSMAMPGADQEGTHLLDPLGGATVRQMVVPLNRTITNFGGAKPVHWNHFQLSSVKTEDKSLGFAIDQEYFAPAQFEEMDDAAKLSRPSFEKMDAGFQVENDSLKMGGCCGTDEEFNTVVVDVPDRKETVYTMDKKYRMSGDLQSAAMKRSAAALAPLTNNGFEKFAPPPGSQPLVKLKDESYLVADVDSLKQETEALEEATTKGAAYQALDRYLLKNPSMKGRLQVVPVQEVL